MKDVTHRFFTREDGLYTHRGHRTLEDRVHQTAEIMAELEVESDREIDTFYDEMGWHLVVGTDRGDLWVGISDDAAGEGRWVSTLFARDENNPSVADDPVANILSDLPTFIDAPTLAEWISQTSRNIELGFLEERTISGNVTFVSDDKTVVRIRFEPGDTASQVLAAFNNGEDLGAFSYLSMDATGNLLQIERRHHRTGEGVPLEKIVGQTSFGATTIEIARDVDLIIVRPNVPTGPLYHLHAAGCHHLSAPAYAHQDPFEVSASTVLEAVIDLYPPNEFMYDPDVPDEVAPYRDDLQVFGCAARLLGVEGDAEGRLIASRN